MAFLGFVIAMVLLHRLRHHMSGTRRFAPAGGTGWCGDRHRRWADERAGERAGERDGEALGRDAEREGQQPEPNAERRRRRSERDAERERRRAERHPRRFGCFPCSPAGTEDTARTSTNARTGRGVSPEEDAVRRARRRAAAEAGFFGHLMSYLGVIALLAFINLLTTRYPWFIWPAFCWGIGLFSHFMAVFGSRMVKERFFDPALERELRRERAVMQTEKQASIDELSSTIAHEIRNPIAAAKSLVQQMGEDPTSVENVEYAKVALEELDRVERRISHLLKFAKEEDYHMALVNIATVVDSALTQMRAKLDAAKVSVARNYIAGPTVLADAEKLRQVFVNVLDNAIDALESVVEGRRVDLFIENGARGASVLLRDNGCGIAAEKIDRIFNPFFTTKDKGTGLGMAIAKKIVEAHAGTIAVASQEGAGSEFTITLPLPR